MDLNGSVGFDDFLPSIVERLGAEGLIEELCKGFLVLTDEERGMITIESLERNARLLGVEGIGREEAVAMVRAGDLDGDGALDQLEFCVLMFRLSPELMQGSWKVVEEALGEEMGGVFM